VASAVVHGVMVDPVLRESAILKVTYLVVGVLGVAAYLYRELLERFVLPVYDYVVAEVSRPNDSTVDVFLEPKERSLTFEAGQFIFLAFGGTNGWELHPFTVASAPTERRLEVSIRALGDYARDLNDNLQPGTPAKAAGPFGGFDYRRGGEGQIWIAGGVGITPFISWIRSLPDDFDREVAFYYSVNHASDAIFLDEIKAAAAAHPTLRPHLVDSGKDGFLTADTVVGDLPTHQAASVYMCGPPAMMNAMASGFESLGIPRNQIRWEQFNIR
jgi:predicted ferric reductase